MSMLVDDRSAPGVRITVLANEKAASGEPLELAGRLLSFSFEDSQKKTDQVSLQLDNFDLALFERKEILQGVTLEVSWGYPGNMAPPRRVVIKKLKGFQTLTLEGQATSVLMNREVKSRAWTNQTRSDVARAIAKEQGYDGDFVDVEDTTEVIETINQSAETDARFLRRLASLHDFDFWSDDAGFHWRSRDQSKAPTHVFTWFADPDRGEVISLSVESDLARRVGRVKVKARSPLTKSTIEAESTNTNTERTTLAEEVEVVDPETGNTELQVRNATQTTHHSTATTPEAAKTEAKARFRKAERATIKLAMQVMGDPTIRAKEVIELRGASSFLSGKYYVTEAKHTISGSGYVTDLKLTRDGTGRRQGSGKRKKSEATPPPQSEDGQPQGGERNRAQASQGMSEVEVVDPVTGDSHVEYRRGGQVIGAEDPEAGMSVPRGKAS
ncbi:MAG: phage late control D family protein [Polyangiaceae bacterium]